MAQLSTKLRSVSFSGAGDGIAFWCPGCDEAHTIRTGGPGGQYNQARWDWDGDAELPTVSPSIRVTYDRADGHRCCHSFVRAGKIEFLNDCTHALAGQTVQLPDWPGDRE